jgi:pimeloyl-ACP methyl ester carboxylesterase
MHRASLDWVRRHYQVDDNRIVVGGVSRGGHGAWDLALAFPDQFAGLLGLIGGPAPEKLGQLAPISGMSFLILQGAHDEAGILEPVRKSVTELKQAGANVLYQEDAEAGHQFSLESVDLPAWLSGVERKPFPKKVTLQTNGETGQRAYWLEVVKVAPDADGRPLVARVTGTIKDSEIQIQSQNARELKLHLHDQLLPLDKPVKVFLNGELKSQTRVPRSLGTMVREFLDRGDRQIRCMAELTLKP